MVSSRKSHPAENNRLSLVGPETTLSQIYSMSRGLEGCARIWVQDPNVFSFVLLVYFSHRFHGILVKIVLCYISEWLYFTIYS